MMAEKRLIDAKNLLKEYERIDWYSVSKDGQFTRGAITENNPFIHYYDGEAIIKNAPTVDAVEVVRCKECKHHRDKNEQEQQYLVEDVLICTSPDATDDCWNAVWPDHFCSYGKRKGCAD